MKQNNQSKTKLQMVLMLFAGIFLCAHNSLAVEMLTLDSAIQTAMENSPSIKQTELGLIRSTENLNARLAALKSNFSLSLNPFYYSSRRTFDDFASVWNTNETKRTAGTFRISQPIKETDGTLSLDNTLQWQENYSEFQDKRTKTFDNSLTLRYSQPIFTYNQTKLELSELELDLENAGYNYAIRKLSLEQSITRSFYNVYLAKMSLEIAQKDLENSQQSYTIQKNKVEAGLLPTEEIYQAELNLANSQSNLLNSRQSLENSFDSFKQLLGISIYDSIDVETDITHMSVEVDQQKALNNGLKARMELRQRDMEIQQAYNNITRTAAQNEFAGNINLSYGLAGTDEDFENIYDEGTNTGTFNLTFDIPLWDWGEKAARMKVAEVGVQQSELSLEDLRTEIIVNVRSAYRELQNLETQIAIARQSVQAAQLTYNINLERYKNGDLTSLDLSLVQDQLTSANLSEIRALINYKNALLDMKILSLWDFVKNEPVIPETFINTK